MKREGLKKEVHRAVAALVSMQKAGSVLVCAAWPNAPWYDYSHSLLIRPEP